MTRRLGASPFMWISVLDWFLAIFSISIWIGAFVLYEKEKVFSWFDNKFGKDDPMPPTPKQQNKSLNIAKNSTIQFDQPTDTNQSEK